MKTKFCSALVLFYGDTFDRRENFVKDCGENHGDCWKYGHSMTKISGSLYIDMKSE